MLPAEVASDERQERHGRYFRKGCGDGTRRYREGVRDLSGSGALASRLLDAVFGPSHTGAADFGDDLAVAGAFVGVGVVAAVVLVQDGDRVPGAERSDPEVDQPFAEFFIEPAVGHVFVEPVDGEDVFAPGGGVAATPIESGQRGAIEKPAKFGAEAPADQTPVQRLAVSRQPSGLKDFARSDGFFVDFPRGESGEAEECRGDEAFGAAEAKVSLDEGWGGDAIAVGEDHVLGVGRDDRLVQDLCLLEAVVLLPDVAEIQLAALAERIDQAFGGGAGSVIGDHQGEVFPRLMFVTPEDLLEQFGGVVGGDDYRAGGETRAAGAGCLHGCRSCGEADAGLGIGG